MSNYFGAVRISLDLVVEQDVQYLISFEPAMACFSQEVSYRKRPWSRGHPLVSVLVVCFSSNFLFFFN